MNIQITKSGLETLKSELSVLVDEKRPKLVERLAYARSQGDLSENSDYQSAREELEFLDGRIDEVRGVIQKASVVSVKNGASEIGVGTKVTLKVNGKNHLYEVVGEWEADPVNKKISHTSPLGQALLGKKKGDKIEVEAPVGKISYEILAIT
ncbi:MAG: transcription elongation factor GreA [Patescibacteria group bacterium]